jgi:NADH-quinone oxidoreductase subunit C
VLAEAELHAAAGPDGSIGDLHGLATVQVPPGHWRRAAEALRDRPGSRCGFFDWLSAYDDRSGFVVAAHVYSLENRAAVLLRTRVSAEAPVLESLTPLWPGADWHERETAEMFGITFAGHPNPVPLLLPPAFTGHPLRKDFPLSARRRPWPGAADPDPAVAGRRRFRPPGSPPQGGAP